MGDFFIPLKEGSCEPVSQLLDLKLLFSGKKIASPLFYNLYLNEVIRERNTKKKIEINLGHGKSFSSPPPLVVGTTISLTLSLLYHIP